MSEVNDTGPVKVYAFFNGIFGRDDEVWMAVAETGEVISSHVSSNRSWGIHDVGPEAKKSRYDEVLGAGREIEFIVLDEGQIPPAEVRERNAKLAEVQS